jgi:hypothetical protein
MKKIRQAIKVLRTGLCDGQNALLNSFISTFANISSQKTHKKYLHIKNRAINPLYYMRIIKSSLHYLKNLNLVRSYRYRRELNLFPCKIVKKIKSRTKAHMATLNIENIQDIEGIQEQLDNFFCLTDEFCLKKGEKKEIAKKLVKHEFLINKTSQAVANLWEGFDDNEWKVINKFLDRIDEVINIVCNRYEMEEDETIQKCLSRLLKSLKNLKAVLEDTLQFKSIASDVRALIEDESDLERLDFAKRIIADARARAKAKKQ